MEIQLAKKAGFCFGVKRAVETADSLSKKEHDDVIYSYGEIIHNNNVLELLKSQGIKVANSMEEITNSCARVIIRAHGVGKEIYNELNGINADIIDMTCPFVKKIHDIVNEYYDKGYQIIIVGDKDHPEVIGINGWCENSAIILYDNIDESKLNNISKACIVAQTTITRQKWNEIINLAINNIKHIVINDTICNATSTRQAEAIDIAKQVDLMIVIGSPKSSNTKKLYSVCKEFCEATYLVEGSSNLKQIMDTINITSIQKVGITAGASTPKWVIDDVIELLK